MSLSLSLQLLMHMGDEMLFHQMMEGDEEELSPFQIGVNLLLASEYCSEMLSAC